MTIRELIDYLEDVALDAPDKDQTEVRTVTDYGDHGHTQQALHIRDVRLVYLRESGYSNSGEAVIEEGEEAEACEGPEEAEAYEKWLEEQFEGKPICVGIGSACAWQEVRL